MALSTGILSGTSNLSPSEMTDSNRKEPEGFEPFERIAPASSSMNMSKNDPTQQAGWERATLEKLAFAALREQRAARRWKIFVRLSWLAFFIFPAWFAVSRGTPAAAKTTAHTAVVEIKGEIANGADASAEFVVAAMKTAFEDEGAKGIVLLINSPGGSPVQAGIINDEIKRMRAKYKKPIYAVVEETCASAAYYIAAATDKIFVDKASIVGSIGVLMDGFGFTGLMDKVGVERRLLTAGGADKGFLDPFQPNERRPTCSRAQQMLDQIHEQFINVVKTGRGDRLKVNTPGLFSGTVLERTAGHRPGPGRPARQRGLRGARSGEGRRGHRLHAARQRGGKAGQEVRRRSW